MCLNLALSFFVYVSTAGSSTPPFGNKSTLFIAIISLSIIISPKTMHSAVWVYISFCESTTSIIRSMILAPPIMVFMRLACPGQSTRVNYKYSYCYKTGFSAWIARNHSGMAIINAEKPKSKVIPLSWDCGFLSKPAVEAIVLKALHKLVLPESMWPNTPMLIFSILFGYKALSVLFNRMIGSNYCCYCSTTVFGSFI